MADQQQVTRVAVLGTGTMGAPMASNLARAGLDVRAWNRSPTKAEALAGDGVTAAGSPAAAADGTDVLLTMLGDGAAVEAVCGDADGALAALAPGVLWLQMSTVGAPAAARLAALAAEHDVVYVDAPVLGSRAPAEAGELTILASGPNDVHDRCAEIFDVLGSSTRWLGAAGAGSALKVVINAWLMAMTASLGETIALAEHVGCDPGVLMDVIGDGTIAARTTTSHGAAMRSRDYEPPRFPLAHGAKDAALALEAAGDRRGAFPVLDATHADFVAAAEIGYGESDWAAVVEAARSDVRG